MRIGPGEEIWLKLWSVPVVGLTTNSYQAPLGKSPLLLVYTLPSWASIGVPLARMRLSVLATLSGPVYTVVPKFTTDTLAIGPAVFGTPAIAGPIALQLLKAGTMRSSRTSRPSRARQCVAGAMNVPIQ